MVYMQRERIQQVFGDMSMSDLLGMVQLKGYSEKGYVRMVYTPHLEGHKVTKVEIDTLTEWLDEDYVDWYRLWQAPKTKEHLQNNIIEIGSYYQKYIQQIFGMTPDLLREDAHMIMGEIAQLVLTRVGDRVDVKDYFKLCIISNTYIPERLAETFKTGLWLGAVTSGTQYHIAYQSLLKRVNFNYMGLNIFSFVTKLMNEGIKDPSWLEEFFNSNAFNQRTIDRSKAKETVLHYIQGNGYDSNEDMRIQQLLSGYVLLVKNEPSFRMLTLTKIDNNTIKFQFVNQKNTSIIVNFGKRRIIAIEKADSRMVVLNEPAYDCSLKKMGETIQRMKTVLGGEAQLVGIMVGKSTLKTKSYA